LFKETIKKTSNTQMYYKAIDFYVEEHPLLLEDLLLDLVNLLDHGRVVQTVKRHGHLALIKKYLNHVQRENIGPVNEAVNELLLNDEDYKGLRASIDSFRNFDQIALAENLKNHELLEFRRLSAYLNKVNKRWKAALDLAKKDSLWKDATEIAAESKDSNVCEDLLRFFVDQKQFECFSAALFTCYELVKPDVVLELAWRNELFNFVMPYLIQVVKEFNENLEKVFKKFDQQEEQQEQKEIQHKKKMEEAAQIAAVQPTMLALPAPPVMGMGGGYGGPSQGMGHMGQMGGFGSHPSNGFFS
jgi:clathrin heavy chain